MSSPVLPDDANFMFIVIRRRLTRGVVVAVAAALSLFREAGRRCWPFFVPGSRSLPHAVHEFWTHA